MEWVLGCMFEEICVWEISSLDDGCNWGDDSVDGIFVCGNWWIYISMYGIVIYVDGWEVLAWSGLYEWWDGWAYQIRIIRAVIIGM